MFVKVFHCPTALLTLLLGFAASCLHAQTPDSIIALRLTEYAQTSATQEVPTSYDFAVYVSFSTPPPNTTTVTLQRSGGAPTAFERQPDGSYQLIIPQNSADALASAYPDGSYLVSVSGGGVNTSTTITVNTAGNVAPTHITNFDLLQALTSTSATIVWADIGGATSNDILSFSMSRPDGTDINAVDPASPLAGYVTETIPQGVVVTADLTYARLVSTAMLNGGATTFGSGTGFNLEFPIYYPAPVPTFLAQPRDAASAAGGGNLFTAQATFASYQWYHNGVAIPGATASQYNAGGTVADAGTYTVVASNPTGSVTSDPAVLSIGTGLQVTDFAGTGTAGSQDGPVASAQFNAPTQMVFDRAGNLYVVDSGNSTIRKISPVGIVSTIAGQAGNTGSTDGPGATALFNHPAAIAIDQNGVLYVGDGQNCTIRKISVDGTVSTLAGSAGQSGTADGIGG